MAVGVSDHFTKFAQSFPVRNTSGVTLAKKVMDEYVCRFGCFEGLHSDQGTNVDGAVFMYLFIYLFNLYLTTVQFISNIKPYVQLKI